MGLHQRPIHKKDYDMRTNIFVCQMENIFRIREGSSLGGAYLALSILLAVSGLFGMEVSSRGGWGWYLLTTAVVIQLSLIWRAQSRQSELWGRPEGDDGIPMMHTHRLHIITQDLMEGELDITPTDGSEIF
jgi:hypothetical protein